MSDDFLKRATSLIDEIKGILKKNENKVIELSSQIPDDCFEFICYRTHVISFWALFKLRDSDFYLIADSQSFVIVKFKEDYFKLSDSEFAKVTSGWFGKKSLIPLDELLEEVPKKAAVFLCYHLDIIKNKSIIK